jgi:hypothetical protein
VELTHPLDILILEHIIILEQIHILSLSLKKKISLPARKLKNQFQLLRKLTLPKQSLRTGSQEVKISMIELLQLLRPEMPPLEKPGTSKMSLMQESGTMELKTLLMPKKISKMKFWTLK